MSDEIRGVAVFHDTIPDHVLFVVCVPDKAVHLEWNEPFIQRLPVRVAGSLRVFEPQWEYCVAGDVLQMSPSVRVSTKRPHPSFPDDDTKDQEIELFHNGRTWSIPFVRWSEIAGGRAENSRWLACHELNAVILG